ncbi:MAG: c-type cytochrome [Cellvibrionaceae bacterium]
MCGERSSATITLAIMLFVLGVYASTSSAEPLSDRQTRLMLSNCVQCHTKPILGAPLIGDQKAWQKVFKKGEEQVLKNVVQGLGSMPPLGYCSTCDEADFRALIKTMSGLPAADQ